MPKAAPCVPYMSPILLMTVSEHIRTTGMVISANVNKTLLCFHSMQHIERKGLLTGYGYSLNFN